MIVRAEVLEKDRVGRVASDWSDELGFDGREVQFLIMDLQLNARMADRSPPSFAMRDVEMVKQQKIVELLYQQNRQD